MLKKEHGIIDAENILDGPTRALFRLDTGATDQEEREANNFAASLLMPTELVTRGWEDVGSVERLAEIFNVSVVAMSIRLSQLGLVQ